MRKAVLVILVILAMIAGAGAEEIKGDWKFPSDIAVSQGKLYVVDGLNNRVAVYDLYGQHLSDIRIDSPLGICSYNGILYVTSQKGKLYVIDGSSVKEIPLRGRPIDVVRIGDKLFVTDGKTESIDVYSLDGTFIKSIGGKGTIPGKFTGIFMADASKDGVFVVDSINAKIQEFSSKGKFIKAFGKFGIEEGNLFRPKGVAYCGNGTVAVSDGITGAVQLFNTYGGFLKLLAKGLNYPTALACYQGKLYVLEPLAKRILILRVQGVK